MSQPKRHELKDTEVSLLTLTTADLFPDILSQPKLKSVRAMAFQHWDKATNSELQVHVMVVRDPSEFLEPFQTEETE